MLSALVWTGAVQATILTPGPGASPPDIFTFTCPGASCPTLLAFTTSTWTNSTSTMSGTYEAAVYSDPNNTFGAGNLDFVYQVSNDAGSTDSIGRVSAINFTGWSTDVGYTSTGSALGSGFVDGTIAPELVDRVSPGDSIGFSFNAPLTTLIAPGQTSTMLIIETNATTYKPGDLNIIDGGVSTVATYEPGSAPTTPEPASMLLMGGGLLLMARIRRVKRVR
ncbi:MAG TPA: PEP-CTERM sorting domain-containing protein [Bryobacteraceae bacterium]